MENYIVIKLTSWAFEAEIVHRWDDVVIWSILAGLTLQTKLFRRVVQCVLSIKVVFSHLKIDLGVFKLSQMRILSNTLIVWV